MTFSYITNIINKNKELESKQNNKKNFELNFYKRNRILDYKNCKSRPVFIADDNYYVYSLLDKFNSFLIKRKHLYKYGFFEKEIFQYEVDIENRVPSSFFFESYILHVGTKQELNEPLVDMHYIENMSPNFYKQINKKIYKHFHRIEYEYIWNKFINKYERAYILDAALGYEHSKASLSRPLLLQVMKQYRNKLVPLRLKELFETNQMFSIYVYGSNKFGFLIFMGALKTGFCFFDKIMHAYLKTKKEKISLSMRDYIIGNVFKMQIKKMLPISAVRKNKSQFVLAIPEKYFKYINHAVEHELNILKLRNKNYWLKKRLKNKKKIFNKKHYFNKNKNYIKGV